MPPAAEPSNNASQASSSDPQSQARSRRRARNRDGPPQLQFLTATDPSQFKNENAKRSVRSQAMIQYRYKSSEQKKKKTGKEPKAPGPQEKSPPVAERVTPIMLNDGTYQSAEDVLLSQWEENPPQRLYNTTSEAWWSTNGNEVETQEDFSWTPPSTTRSLGRSSRYFEALTTIPLNAAAARNVTDYEDTEAHDALLLRLLVSHVARKYTIGDGMDPFMVMPKFASPELNSIYLIRKCNRAFSSPSTMVKWLPAMLSHPHILLSSTIMASTWLDMHEGVSGESKRTMIVKAESIGWINERLRNSATQFEDSTLMIILHVLAGEMWSCNEKTLRIHQAGIARLIAHRGGMERLGGNGAVAQVAAACCYHGDIICEATPLPLFYHYEPRPYEPEETAAFPDSPLFCPRQEMYSTLQASACSEWTYELLCDMRDLTDLFIAHCSENTVHVSLAQADTARFASLLPDYDSKVFEIRTKLASLPSAYTSGSPVTGDWVYESCRIAAIIYTSAIITRVPLSVAAEPRKNAIIQDTASTDHHRGVGNVFNTRLTEALYEVMERTNTGAIWDDMSGVYYWVAAVGAAAARSPITINTYQRPNSRSEAYSTWVRRCTMMFATRAMIILIFQHPLPVLMAQRKLLKIQELISKGDSSTLVS